MMLNQQDGSKFSILVPKLPKLTCITVKQVRGIMIQILVSYQAKYEYNAQNNCPIPGIYHLIQIRIKQFSVQVKEFFRQCEMLLN